MRVSGTKRCVVGIAISVLTFVAYQIIIAPYARQLETMAGTFTGTMFLASPDGQAAMEGIALFRTIAWAIGLAGVAVAAWGWRRRRSAARMPIRAGLLGVFAIAMIAGACEAESPWEPCPVYSTGVVGGCAFDPDDTK